MQKGYALVVATCVVTGVPIVLNHGSAYLINQLPPMPEIPYKNHIVIGCLVLSSLILTFFTVWGSQIIQKFTGVGQSNFPAQGSGTMAQGYTKQYGFSIRHTGVSWSTLFVVAFFHFCHFFPALIIGYFFRSHENINLATTLTLALAGTWIWTGVLLLAWTWLEGWLVVLILLLAGAFWWALCLCLGLIIIWILRESLGIFNSGDNSWSWSGILICSAMGALFFAQAWTWVLGLITALVLASSAISSKEELDYSFDARQSILILILDAVIGTATGGWVGWTIQVMN